jgi:hypothetical protein
MRRLLELLALCGLAIAEPVLRVFGQSPDTFLANDVTGLRVVWFATLVALAPPLVLFGLEQVVRRFAGPRPVRTLHGVLLAVLAGVAALGLLTRFAAVTRPAMAITATVGGIGFVRLMEGLPAAREWVRMLAIGPFVFAALFLFASPVGDLLDQTSVEPIALERLDRVAAEYAATARLGTDAVGSRATDGTSDIVAPPLPDVVLVMFDELPLVSLLDGDGAIDAELYPNFHRLSQTSTWYRNTIAVSDRTRSAVPAALSGRLPPATEIAATAQNHPETVFTLLGDEYRLDVWERLQLCPAQLCPRVTSGSLTALIGDAGDVLNEQLDGEPDAPPPLAALGDRDESMAQVDRLDGFVDALTPADDGRPTLHFIHALLPHSPWQLMPSGAAYADPDPTYGAVFDPWITWGSDELADLARRRHGLQLQYADHQLGAVLDRLEAQGRLDSSVIAVAADHGIGFTRGREIRDFDLDSAPEVAWVPMLVKGVDQSEPVVSDAEATTLDLVPTLADRIGVRVPWTTDGRSLTPDASVNATRRFMDGSRGPDAGARAVDVPETLFDEVLAWDPVGEGDDPALALFRTDAYPELVGRTVDGLRRGSSSPASLRLRTDASPAWDGTGRIPTWVDGDIDGAVEGDPVAVIVNGRIGAIATTTSTRGRPAVVSAIVPESFVAVGTNHFAFALVNGPPGDPTLHAIAAT